MKKILIDGDVIVYRCCFGCKDYDFDYLIDVVENTIINIHNKFEDTERVLVLSNSAPTFRHKIAITAPYKGNRKAEKPPFYSELRAYMVDELGAVMSEEGFEADDYIGMNTTKKDIICGVDKDLLMIPAKGHYNFVTDSYVKVSRNLYYFWWQMLVGDSSDNVIGLDRVGAKTADRMLKGVKLADMRKIVEEAYKKEFGDNWLNRFDENGKLLWIKRHKDREFYEYI